MAGTEDTLTPELVKATRFPWMNSRISRVEEQWLLERSACAPWHAVPRNASLADADPGQRAGLYDASISLFDWFFTSRPRGVHVAKISKCLYLVRPGLFPILDSRMMRTYRAAASDAARMLADAGRSSNQVAYWAAIRRDLIGEAGNLALLRSGARRVQPDGSLGDMVDRLSDLRLLDILAWSA